MQNKKRKEELDKWYKEMRYIDIKKVLIRLKSRKFLTQACTVCLEPIVNDSICRMLNCYHIFHSTCIETWYCENGSCPICKKKFGVKTDKKYKLEEFLQTINVDNECFYSDHINRSEYKLASTATILQNDPYFLKKRK